MDKQVNLKINAGTDISEVVELEKRLAKLKDQKFQTKVEMDASRLDEVNGKIESLKTFLDTVKSGANIPINVDDSDIEKAEKELADLEGKKLDLEIKVANNELKTAQKEIDNLKGEKVDIEIHADTSEIKNAKSTVDSLSSGLGGVGGATAGVVSAMAGKSIWDTVYGTAQKAETNKILLKNMGDTSKGYEEMYNTIDKTTDASLISMQQLIPALNGIKSATGSNAQTINNITPQVADFGQYVLALTGSSEQAESAMFDLSKGIKGAFASLDQYGVTEDALMRTGLWSGKEDDVEGYMSAVKAVTGDTGELMESSQGLEALIGKAFSRGGKKIGNEFLPYIRQALNGFLDLDDATNGWLSTSMLIGGGAISGMVTMLTTIGQMATAYNALKEAKVVQTIVNWALSISEWAVASPMLVIALLIGAIIALFVLLYMNSEQVRSAIDGLGQSLLDLGSYIVDSVVGAFNYIDQILTGSLNSFNNWGNNLINTIVNTARNAVNGFTSWIGGMYNALVTELNNMLSAVGRWASQLWNRFKQAGINAVNSFLAGLGIASPGTMQRTLIWEIQSMGERVPEESRGLIKNIGSLGSDVVNEFGTPNLDMNYSLNNTLSSNAGNNTGAFRDINITVEGDVDSDDRIQQIVDAVTRSLAFDNKTAGRII